MIRQREKHNTDTIFLCPAESDFYTLCLRTMAFRPTMPLMISEFGAGDGRPMLQALDANSFRGRITGYEINPEAASLAQKHICAAGEKRYQVVNASFFNVSAFSKMKSCIAANPPYIPALSPEELILPELWGGPDGAAVLRRLIEQDAQYLLLLIPGIANPESVISYALQKGYLVHDYLLTALQFGRYSSQDCVKRQLRKMKDQGKAFFFTEHYLLAGVLFAKGEPAICGIDTSLTELLTSAGGA